jgi:transposase
MKNTNKYKTKSNRTEKQGESAATKAVTVAKSLTAPPAQDKVTTAGPALRTQPMSAAEFLEERQRQQQSRRGQAKGNPQTEALADSVLEAGGPDGRLAASAGARGESKPHRVIKLGVDVHLDRYVVVRQIGGGTPQPPQSFSPAAFLKWAQKQTELAVEVYTCYEAGPFGYSLHRQLKAMGITNYVVRPRDWDEYGKKVKTDKRDAKQLVLNLDRYLAGNRDAFCVVRAPTEAEEQARSRSRQRESLQKQKQRLAAQGRSHALYYGAHLEGAWWGESLWKELTLPPIVMELLTVLRRLIQAIEQELKAATQALIAAAPQELPMGLGKLTYEVLEREVGDWKRFDNRRQVASYTGMCPREDSSDQRRFQGSINKHGNPRVRHVLVEASWRLAYYQPTYKPVAKWLPVLTNPKTTRSKRKQIIVAIGRQFGVDWWRVRTGRCQAADLGLKLNPAAPLAASTPRARKTKAAGAAKDSNPIPGAV